MSSVPPRPRRQLRPSQLDFSAWSEELVEVIRGPPPQPAGGSGDGMGLEENEEELPDMPATTSAPSRSAPRPLPPGPLQDFCVAMPHLCQPGLDFSQLPQQIKVALAFMRTVCPSAQVGSQPGTVLLPPQSAKHWGRRTLVLDLDETLVHCHPTPLPNVPPPALELQLPISVPPLQVFVYVRPFARLLLEIACSRCWEVVVFTASAAIYADRVLDFLDPERRCIAHRLYRPECTEIFSGFFKDMRRLGRRLDDVVLIENSPLAAGLSPDNSVLVSSWFGDNPADTELLDLIRVLWDCSMEDSIPRYLARRYGYGDFLDQQQRRATQVGESQLSFMSPWASVAGPVTQVQAG